tara:strand:- start:57 stop:290 length:234 start_codon:yes stop_codon:yes gene_type:complete
MARFILDVNSKGLYKMNEKQIDEICQSINEQLLNGEIFRIVCIDDTTDNQFHETQSKNKLNNKQVNNYNKYLKNINN